MTAGLSAAETTAIRPAIPGPRTPLRSLSFTALIVRLRPLCASAVDPLEIAAGLEAEGVNDTTAQHHYGATDVFALADALHAAVPRCPAPPPAVRARWRVRPVNLLLRTAVFGLPGLPFVASGRLLGGTAALAAMLSALLLAWTVSEGLSYLGAVAAGRSGRAGAAAVLRWGGGAAAAVVLPVAAAVALSVGAGAVVTAYAVGQACYLLGATVLLVLAAEKRLFAALLPAAAVSVAALAGLVPVGAVAAAAGGSVLGVVVLAFLAVRGPTARPPRGDLAPAAGSALFGLLAGCLVTFGVMAAVVTRGDVTGAALTALPITLSMGAAEGLLLLFRRAAGRSLARVDSVASFARRAAGALTAALVAHLAILAVLAWPLPLSLARFAVAVLLGGALFLALLLRSFGYYHVVLAGAATALAVEVVLGPGREPAVAGGLLVGLLVVGLRLLTRTTAHR